MVSNYKNTKEWLELAFSNIERVIRNYKINDFSECVFKIQLSIEQLQKALIFLLGLQFRKIHNPSIILESIENNVNINIEKEILERIKKISSLAKDIEGEGTVTRYGIIEDDRLISPEDKYHKVETDKYLKDLKEILINIKYILKDIPTLEQEISSLSKFIKKCKELIKQ